MIEKIPTIIVERPQSKEMFTTSNQRITLQTRLILSKEALNPKNIHLEKVTPTELSIIKSETIDKINQVSTEERADYWKDKGNFDQQLKSWCDSIVKFYNNPRFTEKKALELYHRYFGGNKSESNINVYVDEVIADNTQNGVINFDQLNQNLPEIKKRANIFGGNSAEIIEDIILAKAKLSDPEKKQELIEQVNEEKTVDNSPTLRLNWLNPDEERLLKWFHETSTQTKIVTVEKTKPIVPPKIEPVTESESVNIDPQKSAIENVDVESKTPWDSLPRPDQPIKIKEKQEIPITIGGGQGTIHQKETYLILGTKDHPLVTESIQDDGSRIKQRATYPERPYQIPVGFYFDSDITAEQRLMIKSLFPAIFAELGTPQDFVFNGEISIDQIMDSALQTSKRKDRSQINTSIIHEIFALTKQTEKPHNVVVITNKDMYFGENNFVIGAANADEGTIISLARIWNSIKDPQLRNQVVATEIAHEVGHVYNLPSNRRGAKNIEQSLGGHCKSPGCCMKQGLRVPDDWMTITQNRIKQLGENHFFCGDCQLDIKEKFKKTALS